MSMPVNRPMSTQEARQLEIPSVMGDLEYGCKSVEELTTKLAERLTPLLANRSEKNPGVGTPPRIVRVTSLGGRIDELNAVLQNGCARLQDVLERLEV